MGEDTLVMQHRPSVMHCQYTNLHLLMDGRVISPVIAYDDGVRR